EKTKTQETGMLIPAVITIFEDRSFMFITKTPPVSALIKKTSQLAKASQAPGKDKVGKLKQSQVKEIATTKIQDLNTTNVEAACRMVEGTARSMGIDVEQD
ncbi:50S ribosomal protein L11, partial [Elusimicrobiota bacterium]